MPVSVDGHDGAPHADGGQVLLLRVRARVAQVASSQDRVTLGVADLAVLLVHVLVELGHVIQSVRVGVEDRLSVRETEAVDGSLDLRPGKARTAGAVGGVHRVALLANLPVVRGCVVEVATPQERAQPLRDGDTSHVVETVFMVARMKTDQQTSVVDGLEHLQDTLHLLVGAFLLEDTRARRNTCGHLQHVSHAENVPPVVQGALEVGTDHVFVTGLGTEMPVTRTHDAYTVLLIRLEPDIDVRRSASTHWSILHVVCVVGF